MRKVLLAVVACTTLSGCGARTTLSDSVSGGSSSDASVDASPFDSSLDGVSDAKDSSVPDADAAPEAPLDAPPDQEPLTCPLVQRHDFVQLGTGEGSASHELRAYWTGNGFALLWEEGKTSTYFAFVKDGKTVVQPKVVLEPGMWTMPNAAWNGSELVLFWTYGSDTLITRLDENGDRVVPDKTILAGTDYTAGLVERVGDRFLLTLYPTQYSTQSIAMAWASLQGDLIEGPVDVLEPGDASWESLSDFGYAPLADGAMLFDWAFDSPNKTDLNLQRFDSHFKPTGPLHHAMSELSRPSLAAPIQIGDQLVLLAYSDVDQAPPNGWSLWMQKVTQNGEPTSDIVRIGESSADSYVLLIPATSALPVGDMLLLGTGPMTDKKLQLPQLSLLTSKGDPLSNVPWAYPLPAGPSNALRLAPGSYWGEVAVTFSAFAKQGGHEAFFTVLSCAE